MNQKSVFKVVHDMTSQEIEHIDLKNLHLDLESPRLPLLFKKGNRNTEDIVNQLLEDASIIELMTAIGQNGFFVGEALLVTKAEKGNAYTVVEGNRRLTSLLLLNNPDLASIHKKKIQQVLEQTIERPDKIPCIVFGTRDEIANYIGYRHITGIKSWSLVAKAHYLNQLKKQSNDPISHQSKKLAKQIGSRSDYVKKLLVSYLIYEEIERNAFYKISGLNETTFYFNTIPDSLNKENIRRFIGIDLQNDEPLMHFEKNNLKELIHWFFEKNTNGKSKVLGSSSDLKKLNNVLSNNDTLEYFRSTGDLTAAEAKVYQSPGLYSEEIFKVTTKLFQNF